MIPVLIQVRIVTTVARDQNALPLSGVSSTNSGQLNFTTQQLPHQQVRRVVITASNDNQQRVYQQQQQPQTHGLPVRYSNPGQPQQQYVVRYSQPQQQQQQPTVLVTPGSQQQQQSTVVIGGPPPLRRVDSRPLLLHQPSQQQLLRPPPNNYSQQQQQQQQQSRPVLLVNNQQQQQQQVRYGVAPNTQQQLQQNPQQNLRPGVTFVQPASQLHQPQQRPLQTIIQQQPLQQYPQVIYRQQQPQASYVQSNQQIQQPVYKQVIRPQQLQPQTIVQNPGAQSSEGGRQNASPLVNGVMGGENSKLQGTKSRSYSVNLSHPSGAPLTEEDRRRSLSLLGQTSIEEHHKAAVVQNEVLKRQSSGVFSFIKRKDQQQIPQSQNTARIMDQQQPQQRPEAAGGSSDSPQRQKVPTGINETIPTTSIPVEPKDNTKEDSKPITQESELTKKSLMNGKATVIKDDVQPPERPASRTSGVEEIKQPDVKGDSSVSVAQKSAQDLIQATGTAMLNLKQEKSGALIDGISTESKVDIIKGDSAKEIASKMVVPPEQPLAQGKATVDPVGTSVKQTIPVTEKQIIVNGEIRDDTSISVLSQEKSPSPIPELKQQINGHVEMEYESEGTGKTLSTEKVSPKSQSPRTESPIVQSSVSSSVPKSPVPAEKVTLMSVSPRTESPKPEDTLSPAPKSPIPPEKPLSTSGSSRTESPNPELVQSTISMSPASKSPVPPEKPLNTSVSPLAESPAKELTKSSTPSPAPKSPVPSKSPSPLPSRDVESVRTETPKPSEINVEKSSSTVSESSSPTVKIGGNATEIPQSTTANVPSQETDTSKNMIGTSSEPLPAETKVKIDSPSPEIPGRDIPSTADKAAISTSQEPGVRGPSPIEEKKQPKESVIQQEAVEPAKETSPSQVVSPLKTTSEIKNTNEVASSKEVVPREELLIKEEAAVSQEPVTKEPPPAISRKTPSPEQREITRSPAASNGHERPNSSKEIGKERDSPALIDESKLIIHEADIQRVPPQTSIDDLPEHEKTLLESLDTVCIEASGESKPTSKSPMFMNGHSLNLTKSPSPALSNKSPSPITKKSPSLSKAPSPEQKPVSPISPKSSTKPSPTEGMKSVESKSPKERGSPIVETVINKENESDQLESTVPEKDEKHEVAENGKLSSPEGDASDKLKMENGTPTVKQDKNETTESEDEKVVAKQKIISDDDSKPKKKVIKKRTKESADTSMKISSNLIFNNQH